MTGDVPPDPAFVGHPDARHRFDRLGDQSFPAAAAPRRMKAFPGRRNG